MKSDEVEPVRGLYTKLRIRSEKYRPDNAKIDLRLKQLRFFSVHPGMRSAPFVKPRPIETALPRRGGRGPRGGTGKRVARGCGVPTATAACQQGSQSECYSLFLLNGCPCQVKQPPVCTCTQTLCSRAPEAGLAKAD